MTIDELDAFLPNGLHDAKLGKVAIDFTERTVRLDLNIWVGDEEKREAYRSAEVTLSGLLFWVSDRLILTTRLGHLGPCGLMQDLSRISYPKNNPPYRLFLRCVCELDLRSRLERIHLCALPSRGR